MNIIYRKDYILKNIERIQIAEDYELAEILLDILNGKISMDTGRLVEYSGDVLNWLHSESDYEYRFGR